MLSDVTLDENEAALLFSWLLIAASLLSVFDKKWQNSDNA